MILTGLEITDQVRRRRIVIAPFREEFVNPNSYNYGLGSTILQSGRQPFDSAAIPEWDTLHIGDAGIVLQPGRLYLGHTAETLGSKEFVTSLVGRSSLGRLGLFLQVTADLGHQGAVHRWTLEMHCVQPLRVYAGMRIGQVSFWAPTGPVKPYEGHYAHHSLPRPNVPVNRSLSDGRR
ncbi:deoxycytidine deaminase [Arthrobacter sp. KFRI-F3372]|uniref:dCTP deaminase n=1 Tax=Arthrobacter oryzae TaxID=409290 RepID=UPI00278A4E50|nr:deoxycytidine deaminase [Arthrobacter oryzae]MDP9988317.1 dCTP deaminase [Arthrobacter oryzae]WHP60991.1 deoxycytidine deaminase [Arthrobacter sp. KFRI-F3372]